METQQEWRHAMNTRTTDLYSVWPGHAQETTEQLDLADGVSSIQWEDVPDLKAFSSRREIEAWMLENSRDYRGRDECVTASSILWRFANKIEVGDFIVMPMRESGGTHFSLGLVIGNYRYDADRPAGKHNRRVQWLYTRLPRSVLTVPIGGHGATVTPLYELTSRQALQACATYSEQQ